MEDSPHRNQNAHLSSRVLHGANEEEQNVPIQTRRLHINDRPETTPAHTTEQNILKKNDHRTYLSAVCELLHTALIKKAWYGIPRWNTGPEVSHTKWKIPEPWKDGLAIHIRNNVLFHFAPRKKLNENFLSAAVDTN